MKKLIFESMEELKKMIDIFEKNNIEYSWYFLNKKYELHLGDTKTDHVKWLLKDIGSTVKFKWGDYYW
ncbi:MAG: hypothetical protein FJY65_08670 [Calditrichaeota bacterium]|nr:hypothetical protein [Calditrichota bacterium]